MNSEDVSKYPHITQQVLLYCMKCANTIGISCKPVKHACGSDDIVERKFPYCTMCKYQISGQESKRDLHNDLLHTKLSIRKKNVHITSGHKKAYNDLMKFDERDYKYCPGNETVKSNLLALLLPHFPNVQIYLFGSREIGTATKTSDLDLYVDIDRSYHILALDKLDVIIQTLKEVTNILKANPIEWSNVIPIDASVPIVKAFNNLEMIQCDISFSDGLGHMNTILMKELCALQPIFRSMIIILERWLKMTKQSEYITSYTLKLLVMHYLQSRGILPSVRKLQKGQDSDKSSQIGPWRVSFTLPHNLKNGGELEEDTKNFFKMYSSSTKFNGVVSAYKGISPKRLPLTDKSLIRYQNFIQMYGSKVAYVYNNINVQEPFDLASNPGKNVSKEQLDIFIRLSKRSYKMLCEFKNILTKN